MADKSAIEWTDATWNPVTGCTKVSPGCDHCYAETFAERWRGIPGHHFENGFDVQLRPERLEQPLRWKRPRRIFVNSMSDLFHDDVPDEYIARVFAVMAATPQHTYQILTKRHGRMRSLLSRQGGTDVIGESFEDEILRQNVGGVIFDGRVNDPDFTRRYRDRHAGGRDPYDRRAWPGWPLPNVWLGVSVEDQKWADIRVPALLYTPAAVRFLSCEPLLGPVRLFGGWLTQLRSVRPGVDWVIAGGESGPGARPMHPDWARSLRDQCVAAGVPFFFKQWGGRTPKANGRELDGRTWDEYPALAAEVPDAA